MQKGGEMGHQNNPDTFGPILVGAGAFGLVVAGLSYLYRLSSAAEVQSLKAAGETVVASVKSGNVELGTAGIIIGLGIFALALITDIATHPRHHRP
jgi:hypothetical protein